MKAIVISHYGDAGELKYTDVPDPLPKNNDVIVQSEAIGINFADVMQRRGTYPGGPKVPFVPGLEVCGRIIEKGKSVEGLNIGDRVIGFVWRGAYAEKVVVASRYCMKINDSLSPEEAVAVPVNYQTSYHLLKTLGQIKPGQSVLIHAAAGGVGTASVQLAKIYGATVIATVGSDEKKELVEKLGADFVINYNKIDFEDAVMDYTGHAGVHIALESIGGDCFKKTIKTLRILGKMMVFGFSSGIEGNAMTTDFIYHSRSIMGFHMAAVIRNNELFSEGRNEIQRLLYENKIKPVVGHIFKLNDAKSAHESIESRKTVGKVVLKP